MKNSEVGDERSDEHKRIGTIGCSLVNRSQEKREGSATGTTMNSSHRAKIHQYLFRLLINGRRQTALAIVSMPSPDSRSDKNEVRISRLDDLGRSLTRK